MRLLTMTILFACGVAAIVLAVSASLVGAQSECPNPQLLDTITGSGNQDSPPFTTTTNSFRISYQTTSNDPQSPFYANVESADP